MVPRKPSLFESIQGGEWFDLSGNEVEQRNELKRYISVIKENLPIPNINGEKAPFLSQTPEKVSMKPCGEGGGIQCPKFW